MRVLMQRFSIREGLILGLGFVVVVDGDEDVAADAVIDVAVAGLYFVVMVILT